MRGAFTGVSIELLAFYTLRLISQILLFSLPISKYQKFSLAHQG
jgi:hypothetical protein